MKTTRSATRRIHRPLNVEPHRRHEPFLARPVAVGLVVGGALALVITAIFTVAELSSRVGSQSARLEALNVVAKEVESVRFNLAATTVLRGTGADAATDNLDQANTSLSALVGVDANGIGLDGPEMSAFLETGALLTDAFEQGAPAETLDTHFTAFASAHAALTTRLDTDRADRLDEMQSTNQLLARFAALGGGLVAFVGPLAALYVQRRLTRRRLASYEFDAAMRWLLTTNELSRATLAAEMEKCLEDLMAGDTEAATRRLQGLATWLQIKDGYEGSEPQPTDVIELFANRPDVPGLRRSVDVGDQPLVDVDPTIVAAAFSSIEWAVSQAGGNELVLTAGEQSDLWQALEIQGRGGIKATNLEEIAGPFRSIETALASTGLPVTTDRSNLHWSIDFPLSSATQAEPAHR